MLADDGIRRVRQPEFLQARPPRLLRQIRDPGPGEEASERLPVEFRRDGSAEQARPARRHGDWELGHGFVFEHRHLGLAGGMRQRQKLHFADRLAVRLQLGAERIGERQIHIVAIEQDMLADADAIEVEDAFIL